MTIDWQRIDKDGANVAAAIREQTWRELMRRRASDYNFGSGELLVKNAVGIIILLQSMVLASTPPPTSSIAIAHPTRVAILEIHDWYIPRQLGHADYRTLRECLKSPSCTIEKLILQVSATEQDADLLVEGFQVNKSIKEACLLSTGSDPRSLRSLVRIRHVHTELK